MTSRDEALLVFEKLDLKDYLDDSCHGNLRSGGQAFVLPVVRRDGQRGVFRCLPLDANEKAVARFQREIPILESIDHPGVLKLQAADSHAHPPWYIGERGEPLDKYWAKYRDQQSHTDSDILAAAKDIVQKLASALACCHDRDVIHRDIKPRNIVVHTEEGEIRPVLIDFGLALDNSAERLTSAESAVGNARYSPDVMRNAMDEVPAWVDVFELAQTFLWLVEERPPKHFWQRPVHWRHVHLSPNLTLDEGFQVSSVAAACSLQATGPPDGKSLVTLLESLWTASPGTCNVGETDSAAEQAQAALARGKARAVIEATKCREPIEATEVIYETICRSVHTAVVSAFGKLVRTRYYPPTQYPVPQSGYTAEWQVDVGADQAYIRILIKTGLTSSMIRPNGEDDIPHHIAITWYSPVLNPNPLTVGPQLFATVTRDGKVAVRQGNQDWTAPMLLGDSCNEIARRCVQGGSDEKLWERIGAAQPLK